MPLHHICNAIHVSCLMYFLYYPLHYLGISNSENFYLLVHECHGTTGVWTVCVNNENFCQLQMVNPALGFDCETLYNYVSTLSR